MRVFESEAARDCLTLYSTKKASMIEVPSGMLEEIKTGRISETEQRTLSSLGFLCESLASERDEMIGLIDDVNGISRTFAAKVVMDLDCNLACKYCFEGQRKGKFYMSREAADLFVRFVETWIKGLDIRTGEEKVVITFYGGEPLLSLNIVAYLSENLKNLSERNGIEYIAYMVTNGTLLTRRVVEKLMPLGLAGAVVTLDGPPEIHNRYRPLKSGSGSFESIFKNLLDIGPIMGIQVNSNFIQENFRQFPGLLDYMLDHGLSPDNVESVNFNPVTVESEGYGPADFHEGCCSIVEPWLFEATLFLREETLRRGFKAPTGVVPGICSLDIKTNYLINYDGGIYKCPGLIGREEFKIGDLLTGVRHLRQPQGKDCWKNDECLDCVYLPLCFGGCRYMKLVRDGNMDGVDCRRAFFDATLEAFVKQDIKYGLCKPEWQLKKDS